MPFSKAAVVLGFIFFIINQAFAQTTGPGGVGDASTMNLWLDASQLTGFNNGDNVPTWTDFSGNSNNAIGSNNPRYSQLGAGGMPAISFNGSNEFYTIPSAVVSSLTQAEVFVITELDADPPGTVSGLWDFGSTTDDEQFPGTDGRVREEFGTTVRLGNPNPSTALTDGNIYNVVTQSGSYEFFLNASSLTSRASNTVSFTASPRLGRTDGSNYLDGNISEIVIFNTVLNDAEKIIVNNHYSSKYSVAVSNDRFAFDGPYKHEVAGIGRIDASNLHDDAQGIGLVRLNTPSALSDDDFLLWGHNNASLNEYNELDVDGTNIESRLTRIWRLDETDGGGLDGVGTVTISFDVSDVGGSITGSDLRLMIDRDGDGFFDNDVAPISGTFGSNIITFNAVDFNDGDYFTLGSINVSQTPLGSTTTAAFNHLGPGGVGDSASMTVWVKADELLQLDGSNVPTWTDFSGNGNDLIGSNNPRYSQNGIGGSAAIEFNGTNEFYSVPLNAVASLSEAEVFVITELDADPPGTVSGLWDFGSTTDDEQFPGTDGRVREEFGTTIRLGNPNPSLALTDGNIYNVITETGRYEFLLNEGSLTSRSSNIVSFTTSARLGRTDGSNYYDGKIGEMVIYNQALDTSQRIIVNNYLSSKYGISISNDRFAYDPDYRYQVAGIGQHNATDFHKDAQGSGLVRINTPSALSDEDYLLWGHNNGSLEAYNQFDVDGTTIESRMTRVWRMDETDGGNLDGVGTVTISFDVSGVSGAITGSDLRLLIDRDGDGFFDNDVAPASGSFVSNIITFTAVDFSDGDFFTLGSINVAQTPLGNIVSTALNNLGPGGVGDSASMTVWVKADELGLADGANVATWTDFSGNGNDLIGSNNPRYSQNGIGGEAAIDFNGTNEFYSVPLDVVSALTEAEVFIVTELDADPPGTVSGLWDFGASSDDEQFPGTDGRVREEFGTTIRLGNPNPSLALTDGNIYNVISEIGNYEYLLNATTLTSRASNIVGFTSSPRLGRTDGSNYYDGQIAEMVIYNSPLNTAQRIIVNNYLASKYGITVTNDRFSYDPDYRFQLAGIGQHSSTEFHKDSKGSGMVRVNTPSALSDNDYLLWGHNNGSLTAYNQLDVDGTTIESRMTRVWRLNETDGGNLDGVGTINISFDVRGISGSITGSDLRLLIDRNGDGFFDNDVAPTSGSFEGNVITFSAVDFSDGDFFTLGSINVSQTPLGDAVTTSFNHLGPGGVGDSASMTVWVKADELGLSDGDNVPTWTDFSGNGNDLIGSNNPRYSQTGIGGAAAIEFNGTNEFYNVPLAVVSSLSEAEVFVVTELDADPPGTVSGLWDFGASSDDEQYPGTDGRVREEFGTTIRLGNPNPSLALTDASIYNVITQSGSYSYILNETTLASRASNIVGFTSSPRLGRTDGSNYYDGKIGEFVIYNQSINTAQRVLVNNYLASKYGVAISNDLYAHEPDYRFEVAGIGRENIANFHNDAQGSGLVRINTLSALSDGDYLFWGHNNSTLSAYNTIDVDGVTIESRMSRVWQLDETDGGNLDGVGTLTISFDMSGVSGSITGTDLRLMIDRDGDGFSDNDVAPISGTYNGNLITFTAVDFEDDDLFTIGSINRTQTPLGLTIVASLNNLGPGGVGDENTMTLWVRADELNLTDGANVPSWEDFSGNSNDLTGVNNPTFVASGTGSQPAVRFNGSNEFFNVPIGVITGVTEAEAYIIPELDADPPASVSGLWDFGTSTDDEQFPGTDGRVREEFGTTVRLGNPNPSLSLTNGNIYNVKSQSGSYQYLLNESSLASRGSNIVSFTSSPRLGRTDGSNYYDGTISEFVIYKYILNSAQQILVNNYFSSKYSISIINDKYAHDATYGNEVAGIGRENSANIHDDAQGSGVLRINNPDDLEDGEYFVWGHDGGLMNTVGETDFPPEVEGRIRRVWRADESGGDGDVGNFDFYIDLSSLTISTPSDVRILIDTDADGLFIDETVAGGGILDGATDVGAGLYRFNAVNLSDGDLFTIGTINESGLSLPITLVNFNAFPYEEDVKVIWTTSSEINNDYFTIEKSQDLANWNLVEIVDGANNSTREISYSLIDQNPYNGGSYYRLTQTDYNGRFEIFEPVYVELEQNLDIEIIPNPTKGNFVVQANFNNDVNESIELRIKNLEGKVVLQETIRALGQESNEYFVELNGSLAAGVYLLEFSNAITIASRKLVVVE